MIFKSTKSTVEILNKKLSCCCDSRLYCIQLTAQLQTMAWNSHGHHEYLLIYSFELKSAFGGHQLFCHLWLNDTSYSNFFKCLKK